MYDEHFRSLAISGKELYTECITYVLKLLLERSILKEKYCFFGALECQSIFASEPEYEGIPKLDITKELIFSVKYSLRKWTETPCIGSSKYDRYDSLEYSSSDPSAYFE